MLKLKSPINNKRITTNNDRDNDNGNDNDSKSVVDVQGNVFITWQQQLCAKIATLTVFYKSMYIVYLFKCGVYIFRCGEFA